MSRGFLRAVKVVKVAGLSIEVEGSIKDLWDSLPEGKFGFPYNDFYTEFVRTHVNSVMVI